MSEKRKNLKKKGFFFLLEFLNIKKQRFFFLLFFFNSHKKLGGKYYDDGYTVCLKRTGAGNIK